MITNILHFVAFVVLAYLTTCLCARPSSEQARIRVRSARPDEQRRH